MVSVGQLAREDDRTDGVQSDLVSTIRLERRDTIGLNEIISMLCNANERG